MLHVFIGGSGAGGSDFRSQMTQQMLSNPEMLQQALDNPLVQNITSNPDLMRSVMMSNPEMQDLVEVTFFSFCCCVYACSKTEK